MPSMTFNFYFMNFKQLSRKYSCHTIGMYLYNISKFYVILVFDIDFIHQSFKEDVKETIVKKNLRFKKLRPMCIWINLVS